MEEKFVFTEEEKHACEALTKEIHEMLNDTLSGTDVERLHTHIHSEIELATSSATASASIPSSRL